MKIPHKVVIRISELVFSIRFERKKIKKNKQMVHRIINNSLVHIQEKGSFHPFKVLFVSQIHTGTQMA